MKKTSQQTVREDWDQVRSINYKLPELEQSVVYAELDGVHGQVETKEVERVYYILEGKGEFVIDGEIVKIEAEDVITVPPHTTYDYWPLEDQTLKIISFMELWDN